MQSIFGFIIHPMELGVIWLAVHVGSAGIGIILFTLAVRLVLAPLLIVQLRNAKAMQRVQPLVAEVKKKHGKDREKVTQATMALYKEHNVNPAMGCLPTLLQFPVLIGLFYGLLHLGQSPTGYPKHITYVKTVCNGIHVHNMTQWLAQCYATKDAAGTVHQVFTLFHANFLWLSNGLGGPDPFYILPVLAGATQWVQSRMMLSKSVDPQQQMMNNMMNFMPLMIIFFALRYASGLSLYWVTSTLIGIAIQYRITGLGLLPDALRGLSRGMSRQTASSGFTSKPKPSKPARTTSSSNGAHSENGSRSTESKANADVPANGEDGIAPEAPIVVARPRRKTNRPRGGKNSGRRG